ncbi:MAG: hypothetical protein ACP5MH_11190 [Thermoproteus sp.]
MLSRDAGHGTAELTITILDSAGRVKEVKRIVGNVFLTCGVQILWQFFAGQLANSNIGICSGDGSASASSSQTCLQGTHQQCVPASSIDINGNQLTVTAKFGGDQGNYSWNEVAVADLAHICPQCSYAPIDRLAAAIGVKQPGETWVVQMTLSIS